jgi:hypothetical protein
MNAELQGYGDQLVSVRQDAVGLMSGLSEAQFNWRPAPERWSMAGCFEHLNKTASLVFNPRIRAAIIAAKAQGPRSDGPFAYSAFERWCVKMNDAPAGMRFKAPKLTRPSPSLPVGPVRDEFVRCQDELQTLLRDADGLDLRRIRVPAPIPGLKFSLGTMIRLMLAHERRHTWQARRVRQDPAFPA